MTDQRDLLQASGEALFGAGWREKLAQALNADSRLFRRYLAETVAVTPERWKLLADLLRRRADEVDRCLLNVADKVAAPTTPPAINVPRSSDADGA